MTQAKRGEDARVHTAAMLTARRGRPVGSVAPATKAKLNLWLELDKSEAL